MCVRLSKNVAAIFLLMVSWFIVQDLRPLHAQSTSFGVIVGTVTDPSQAAVPDVSLTVTNTQTGIARQLKTDQAGEYRVPSLMPGTYSVKAEHAGFQIAEVGGVILPVAQTVTVNIVMQIGAVTQTVAVTTAAPQLDTATATVGSVINNTGVVTLPLNGRAYTDLLLLVPGAVQGGSFFAIAGGHNYSVSGMNYNQNNYTIDGMNANEQFFKQFGIQPSIDAIQEFKIQTHITSAEYGVGAGANVNVALRTGTNRLHGSAFEFLRNDKLDAVDWFRNATSTTKPDRPAYKRNQWGFVVAGPLYIPKVYDGRDKLFWMFNYEGQKIRQPSTIIAHVPTTAQLGGDFRGNPPIFDPATTTQTGTDGSGNPIYSRQQFACNGVLNTICPERISPAALALAQMYYPTSTTYQFINTNAVRMDQYQVNSRADYKFTDKLSFFAHYSQAIGNQLTPETLPVYYVNQANKFKHSSLNWTYLASPTTVLDIRAGVNRQVIIYLDQVPPPGAKAFYAAHPLQGLTYGNGSYPMLLYLHFQNFSDTASGGAPWPTTDIQAALNFTKIVGKHTFKMGGTHDNFRGMQDNYGVNQIYFNSKATSDPQNQAATGYDMASYLLGLPGSAGRNLGTTVIYGRWGLYQFYVQDDIRLTRKLTVNLGLRYEWDQLLRDRDNRLSQFDVNSGQFVWAGTNPVTGAPPNVRRTLQDPDMNNFAPRLGIAYQLNPKTTLRLGYGIFYATNNLWEQQGPRGQWPYAIGEAFSDQNWPFPNRPIETFFSANTDVTPGYVPGAGFSLNRMNRSSYTQQYNLGVQRQLAHELMLEVDYIGTKGTKMPLWFSQNLAPAGPGPVDPRRPWPQYSAFSYSTNVSSTIYHALQVRLEKRFSNGVQFLGSYAWSHYIDTTGSAVLAGVQPQNPYDWNPERASGALDRRHTLTMSYVYQLPFGRGKRYLSSPSGIVNQLIGGWELSGITRFSSGSPYTVGLSVDNANTGTGGQRPNLVGGVPLFVSTTDKRVSGLNPLAFALPDQYTFGNLGRNTFSAPGFSNWDLGLFKNFPLQGEKRMLQFRAEFFNAFNNVSMGGPDGTWTAPVVDSTGTHYAGQPGSGNPNFGQVFGTQSTARVIQVALKFIF
jgi:hypothetical protein